MPKLPVLVLPLLLLSSTVEAAETRYVASNGTANDTCSRSAPCNTLQRAVNVSSAGGEVVVLDSSSYGNSLTINRSITISADGVTATLVDPGNITIANANAVVVLRGLHLKGAGTPGVLAGILISAAAAVHIERCTIERFNNGIQISEDDDIKFFVTDSIVRNNAFSGLTLTGFAQVGVRTIMVENSRFENNGGNGVVVHQAQATIVRSVLSGNGGSGVVLNGGAVVNGTRTTAAQNDEHGFAILGAGSQITLESSAARGNSTGLHVATGTARISRSVFTDNVIGIDNDGVLQRLQNNTLEGNGTNFVNTGTVQAGGLF